MYCSHIPLNESHCHHILKANLEFKISDKFCSDQTCINSLWFWLLLCTTVYPERKKEQKLENKRKIMNQKYEDGGGFRMQERH